MYTLTGKALSAPELERIPKEFQFHVRDRDVIDSIQEADLESAEKTDLGVALRTLVTFQCPVGPHGDPGLSGAVLRACSIGPTKTVAVECTQGHWAQYPCL